MTFTVPGKPIPKGRPRVMRGGWTFTPKRTKDHEERIRFYFQIAAKAAKFSILEGSVGLSVTCYGSHPRSDWDNLGKIVSDALNGAAYKDDSQIVIAQVVKIKCEKGKEKTDVNIWNIP